MQTKKIGMMILRAVALGMGVAVVVLSVMQQLEVHAAVSMLGVGLTGLAAAEFLEKE